MSTDKVSLKCDGNGVCLVQCGCGCYDEDTDTCYELCACGHREHGGYCPSNCCQLVQCRNFVFCKTKYPQWLLYCHNHMCVDCAIQMGPHSTTDIILECIVCLISKNMIKLKCNHLICNDCWYRITYVPINFSDESDESNISDEQLNVALCPICRNLNIWK